MKAAMSVIRTLLVAGVPMLSIYASHPAPDYPVRAAGDYTIKVTTGTLIAAAEPMEDSESQKTYFHSRLPSRGMLPVLLIVQNTSAAKTYLFDRDSVGLGEGTEVTGKGARKFSSRLGSGGLIDLTLVSELTDLRENLIKKEIRSATLSPGSSIHGFVYAPVPANAARKRLHLQVPLTDLQTSETEVMNLFF